MLRIGRRLYENFVSAEEIRASGTVYPIGTPLTAIFPVEIEVDTDDFMDDMIKEKRCQDTAIQRDTDLHG